jgi:hypothetical protein
MKHSQRRSFRVRMMIIGNTNLDMMVTVHQSIVEDDSPWQVQAATPTREMSLLIENQRYRY